MEGKKFGYFNRAEVCGVVTSFAIKEFDNGGRLANIGVKDEKTTNLTFVSVFDRKGLKYGNEEVTLDGLKKIFMTPDGKSRGVVAKFTGKAKETTSVKDGVSKTYFNVSAFEVKPVSEDEEHYAILILNGMVDAIKIGEDANDNQYAKIRVGVQNTNKDGDIIGVDYLTVFTRDERLVEKLEDVERHSFVKLQCDVLNTMPKTDRFGNIIENGRKENVLVNLPKNGITLADDVDEDVVDLYKAAKRLEKGETIKVGKKSDDEPVAKPKDDIEDSELDF